MRFQLLAAFVAMTTACAGAAPGDSETTARATSAIAAPTSSSSGKHIPFGPEGVPTVGSPVRPSPPCLAKAHPPITYVPLDDVPTAALPQADEASARLGDEVDLPCTPIENPTGTGPTP
ncbi:MAG: hypothetical protein NVS3B10_30570 [Polyangiales bacterium]